MALAHAGVVRYTQGMAGHTATTECAECTSSDLAVVFGHDCPADPRYAMGTGGARARAGAYQDTSPRYGTGQGTGRRTAEPPTDAQLRYLARLAADRGIEVPTPASKRQASQAIDQLVKLAKAAAVEATTAPAAQARRNRYAAQCADCGAEVAADTGLLSKGARGWEVRHDGACPTAPAPSAPAPATAPQVDVPAGHYAIDPADPDTAANQTVFYRVDRPTEGTYAGRTFVKLVVGGHPDSNVARGAVAGILARIAEAGPDAAARRYGQEIGRCSRCNRHLTDDTSRDLGIGPECRKARG